MNIYVQYLSQYIYIYTCIYIYIMYLSLRFLFLEIPQVLTHLAQPPWFRCKTTEQRMPPHGPRGPPRNIHADRCVSFSRSWFLLLLACSTFCTGARLARQEKACSYQRTAVLRAGRSALHRTRLLEDKWITTVSRPFSTAA